MTPSGIFVVCYRCLAPTGENVAIRCPSGRYLCQPCYKLAWREAHGNDGVLLTTEPTPECN